MRCVLCLLAVLSASLLTGCDPAPSVPLAPERKAPDTSKMSPADVDKMLKQNAPVSAKTR